MNENQSWNEKIDKLKLYVKRIGNLLFQNKEDQIKKIKKKIEQLIPNAYMIEDRIIIKKIINIYNSLSETIFKKIAENLGLDLLNSLMYLHEIIQSNTVSKTIHEIIHKIKDSGYNQKEMINLRRITRYILNLEYTLISSMEYLLKCHKEQIISFTKNTKNSIGYILKFIEEFFKYLYTKEQLLWLKSPFLEKVSLILGPGLYYYFKILHSKEEIRELHEKKFDIYLKFDLENEIPDFNELINQFSELKEIWISKLGYDVEKYILAVLKLNDLMIEKFNCFFSEYQNFFVPNIKNVSEKHIEVIDAEFKNYLVELIENYYKNARNYNCIIDLKDLRRKFMNYISNDKKEIAKIIRELCIDPQEPFIATYNTFANRFIFPLGGSKAFFYPNNTYAVLKERLYMELSKIGDPEKESVLLRDLKRILESRGYNVHPLSGIPMIGQNKKIIGEIDIIAYKLTTLLIIESKIIPYKKTSVTRLETIDYTLKNISKKLTRFDKNIEYFFKLCNNSSNFLNYNHETLDINRFNRINFFFISPDIIYNPPPFKRERKIELVNPRLFERMI